MPPADNITALAQATRRRAAQARARAERALAAAGRGGRPVTVAGLAKTAGVSRSWLYTQPDLMAAVRHLQQRHPAPERTGPQPATVTSLRHRLDTALARIKQLRADNADLTRQLETAHGEIRRLRYTPTATPTPAREP
jgi:small-conductance mechanosensitive channel